MSSEHQSSPRVFVVGSINADVFLDIDRLPRPGETMSTNRADSGHVLPGGKGANQAVAVANSAKRSGASEGESQGLEVHWAGRFGNDAHAGMLRDVLRSYSVSSAFAGTADVPTGQAYILLQKGGQNSIILVGGANHSWPSEPHVLSPELVEALGSSRALLLQREVSQVVNIASARAARAHGVPVFLDMGGEDAPLPDALLAQLTTLSANETELARLTDLPTDSDEQVRTAAQELQKRWKAAVEADAAAAKVQEGLHVLVTLGERGSMLLLPDGSVLTAPAHRVSSVVDTTGAGDCFRGCFVTAFLEKQPLQACLEFASAAAALCIQKKGAMPSMPLREDIDRQMAAAAASK